MPSPTHITTYAVDALSLLTSRYSKARPDPPAPPPTPEDELGAIAWQRATGALASITVPASSASQGASYYSLSAAGACALPATPNNGEDVYVNDEDGTAVAEGVVVNGGGHNIIAPDGSSAATFTFSQGAWGYAAFSTIRLSWITGANVWKVFA